MGKYVIYPNTIVLPLITNYVIFYRHPVCL